MDNGEIEVSNQAFSSMNDADQTPSGCSMDSFFDEILKDTHACTHTHTCNPPGPDMSHTHTCFHVHTKILAAPNEIVDSEEKGSSKKRSFGNREAVRKYREKKKAWTASLEDEVTQLREINRQLLKRLQNQSALESEVARLRCLLVDVRGRIEGEIGSFPYQKSVKSVGEVVGGSVQSSNPSGLQFLNSCDMRCGDKVYCQQMQGTGEWEGEEQGGQVFGVCDVGAMQCGSSGNCSRRNSVSCGSRRRKVGSANRG
ncbi:basic leucine zipper 19-like [Wolffia australiana]